MFYYPIQEVYHFHMKTQLKPSQLHRQTAQLYYAACVLSLELQKLLLNQNLCALQPSLGCYVKCIDSCLRNLTLFYHQLGLWLFLICHGHCSRSTSLKISMLLSLVTCYRIKIKIAVFFFDIFILWIIILMIKNMNEIILFKLGWTCEMKVNFGKIMTFILFFYLTTSFQSHWIVITGICIAILQALSQNFCLLANSLCTKPINWSLFHKIRLENGEKIKTTNKSQKQIQNSSADFWQWQKISN